MADSTPSTEIWRPVVGWPGYEVSDMGRVRSIERTIKRGKFFATYKSALLKPQNKRDNRGRVVALAVWLCHEGRAEYVRVHRLVLEAFVGPCPDGLEGCHGDGNPENNCLGNLRWDTPKANGEDSIRHGTKPNGRAHWNVRLSEQVVAEIRSVAQWQRGDAQRFAEKYGVTPSHINGIRTGKYWRHAPGVTRVHSQE